MFFLPDTFFTLCAFFMIIYSKKCARWKAVASFCFGFVQLLAAFPWADSFESLVVNCKCQFCNLLSNDLLPFAATNCTCLMTTGEDRIFVASLIVGYIIAGFASLFEKISVTGNFIGAFMITIVATLLKRRIDAGGASGGIWLMIISFALRIRPANNVRSPSPPHELIVHPERSEVQKFLTNFAPYHEDLNVRIEELEKRLEDKGKRLKQQGKRLEEQGKQLKEQRKQLNEQRKQLNEQGKQLEEQGKQLEELKNQLAQQNVLAPAGEEMAIAKNLQTPKMQLTRPRQSSQRHSLLPQKQSVPQLRSEATMSVVRRTTPVLRHSIDKGLPSTSAATAQKPILNKPLIQPPMRFGNIRPLTPSTSTTRGRGKAEGVSHVVRGTPIQRPSSHSGNIEQKEQK